MNPTRIRNISRLPHFAALHHRDYRYTWTANMFSGAAMWTFVVAASWLVLERSDSSGWVGIITFAGMIPFLIVSPFAGLLADRMDRRKLAIVTFSINIAVTSIAAILTITGLIELWHLAVLAFANGVFRATQEPAVQALIPNQVPKEDLLNAITLNSATRHGARFFGLLVAAPLLAVDFIGISGVLVLSAVFQAAGTFQLLRVRTVSRGESAPEHGLARSIVDGMVYIYTNKTIAIFILLVAFHCALVMSNDSLLPIFSKEDLGAGDGATLGLLVMAFGVGSLFATLFMAGVRNERRKGQLLIWTGIMSGVTPVMLAFSPNVSLAVVSMAAMGAAQSTFMALTNTYIQTVVPDRIRGRISSLYILHAGGVMAFANLGYGFMADTFSAPPILFITGVIFIAVVFSLAVGQADLRRVYRTGRTAPVQSGAGA
jgi:MFS family permease